MSVSALYALETIFYLRLQLEQALSEEKDTMIEVLCRKRFEQLAKVFVEKYGITDSVNSKVEILERVEVITLILIGRHCYFALEDVSMIEDEPSLTYAQRLRLKWLPALTSEDYSKIVAELFSQTDSSFEMATLALISYFCTDKEHVTIFDRYLEIFDAALYDNNTAELGNLLALAAYWNNSPSIRSRLTEIDNKVVPIKVLFFPEKRVNHIAVEIYVQLDILTGKYSYVEEIPA